MRTRLAALLAAATLAACGGDGAEPPPSPAGEPNETAAQATPLTVGTAVTGTIASEADLDFYVFTVPAGGASVRFQTFDAGGTLCDPTNEGVDPYLDIFDGAVTHVAHGDDVGAGAGVWCEDLTVSLAAGTNYVSVGGFPPVPFTYVLKVTIP